MNTLQKILILKRPYSSKYTKIKEYQDTPSSNRFWEQVWTSVPMVAPPAAAAKVADPSRAVSQLRSLLGNARTVRSQFGAQSIWGRGGTREKRA